MTRSAGQQSAGQEVRYGTPVVLWHRVFTQPCAGLSGQRRDQQIAKAEKAIAGKTAVKRNRFVRLASGTRTVNRTLETKARATPGNCMERAPRRPSRGCRVDPLWRAILPV